MPAGPDFQCTWAPEWLGFWITDACIAHDLGLSDEGFYLAIVALGAAAGFRYWNRIVAGAYYIGVKVGRPFYRLWRRLTR